MGRIESATGLEDAEMIIKHFPDDVKQYSAELGARKWKNLIDHYVFIEELLTDNNRLEGSMGRLKT